jgi:hypothetical protein
VTVESEEKQENRELGKSASRPLESRKAASRNVDGVRSECCW